MPAQQVRHLLDGATAAGRRSDAASSAHALLRVVLTGLTGTPPGEHALIRTCARCGGPHGKPVLVHPVLHVSLSYVDSCVLVAVTAAGPVGVDVDVVAATDFDGFAGVALAPDEQDGPPAVRARAWTRKEAVLKATGAGLAVDPRTVDVRGDVSAGAQLYDLALPEGLAGAVAVLARRRPVLRLEQLCLSG